MILNNSPSKDRFVAYYRRSKKEQDSNLGLEAQRTAVEKFVQQHAGSVIGEYTELESGTARKRHKRFQVQEAITHVKKEGATLLIAKMDRLSRDLEFTSMLYNADIPFICCDSPGANEITIKFITMMAENEANEISKRTKAALVEAVKQGKVLGSPGHKIPGCKITDKSRAKAIATVKDNAAKNPNNKRGSAYAYALAQSGISYARIANSMNEEGFESPRGMLITENTIKRWIDKHKT